MALFVFSIWIHLNLELRIHLSCQIIIFHQPGIVWNEEISLHQLPFGVRSCEVARFMNHFILFVSNQVSLSVYHIKPQSSLILRISSHIQNTTVALIIPRCRSPPSKNRCFFPACLAQGPTALVGQNKVITVGAGVELLRQSCVVLGRTMAMSHPDNTSWGNMLKKKRKRTFFYFLL